MGNNVTMGVIEDMFRINSKTGKIKNGYGWRWKEKKKKNWLEKVKYRFAPNKKNTDIWLIFLLFSLSLDPKRTD
jgi:hypothetical protein